MNPATTKASLVFIFSLCVPIVLVFLMVQSAPEQPTQVNKISRASTEPIKVVAVPIPGRSAPSKPPSASESRPNSPSQTKESAMPAQSKSEGLAPATPAGSARELTRLDERNSPGAKPESRNSEIAAETSLETIESWSQTEKSRALNNIVGELPSPSAKRRLRLPASVNREPAQPPVLFFDWSIPLLRELVSRNLGCVIVRDSASPEPIGMLTVTDTGWRFASFTTPIPLAGVKLSLDVEEQPSARELLDKAQWATGRTRLLLEFFPSAPLWTAWLAEQQAALLKAKLPISVVAVTAGSIVWETDVPRYNVDEVAFLNGKREMIALSRRPFPQSN
jgi:hypothetical protein